MSKVTTQSYRSHFACYRFSLRPRESHVKVLWAWYYS